MSGAGAPPHLAASYKGGHRRSNSMLIANGGTDIRNSSPTERARDFAQGIQRKDQNTSMTPVEGSAETLLEFVE